MAETQAYYSKAITGYPLQYFSECYKLQSLLLSCGTCMNFGRALLARFLLVGGGLGRKGSYCRFAARYAHSRVRQQKMTCKISVVMETKSATAIVFLAW